MTGRRRGSSHGSSHTHPHGGEGGQTPSRHPTGAPGGTGIGADLDAMDTMAGRLDSTRGKLDGVHGTLRGVNVGPQSMGVIGSGFTGAAQAHLRTAEEHLAHTTRSVEQAQAGTRGTAEAYRTTDREGAERLRQIQPEGQPAGRPPGSTDLYRQPGDGGGRPTPWPPERRDPHLTYQEDGQLRRTRENIDRVLAKYGITLNRGGRPRPDASLRGAHGKTEIQGRGRPMRITPAAFMNEEQLARTLYHENIHVAQINANGGRYPTSIAERNRWEQEAHAAEDQWWENHPLNPDRGQAT